MFVLHDEQRKQMSQNKRGRTRMTGLEIIAILLGLINFSLGVSLSNIYSTLEKIEKDLAAIAKQEGDAE